MPQDEVLPPEGFAAVSAVGQADLVVGIPSYQNARTIGHVARAVQVGISKYFPDLSCLILNSDGGSTDGTREVIQNLAVDNTDLLLISHRVSPIHRLTTPYHGVPGKGSAIRGILRAAEILEAKACAVVDADLRSITPEWIHLLLAPVLTRGFDYVSPYYARHKFDGTITNNIVYPATRALYGKRVRQPIGGDFGFSGRLASHYLAQPVWDSDVARFGIDIWMTVTAICGGFRVAQSFLGAKIHDHKDPGAHLSDMLVQVLGSLYRLMEVHESVWLERQGSDVVPLFGFAFDVGLEPVAVDVSRLVNRFQLGAQELGEIWRLVMAEESVQELQALAAAASSEFHLRDHLWVRLVYDFGVAWHLGRLDRRQLLASFLPLYLGRVASFVLELTHADKHAVEDRIEELCLAFENDKDYLRTRWRPDTRQEAAAPPAPSEVPEPLEPHLQGR
jgi:glycosyltransferase involved in cell wall biosynthesis